MTDNNTELSRRRYLGLTTGVVASVGTAGCLGFLSNNNSPPPRRSNLVTDISVESQQLVVNFVDPEDMWLMSRRDIDVDTATQSSVSGTDRSGLGSLLPVRPASAKGRGATGRGTANRGGGSDSTPRSNNGYLWYGGGAYAGTWYNNHDDEVNRYPVTVGTVGLARLGNNTTFRSNDPGPGPVTWDNTYNRIDNTPNGPDNRLQVEQQVSEGWRRIGVRADTDTGDEAPGFGWESFDVWVQNDTNGFTIAEQWKVSPRI